MFEKDISEKTLESHNDVFADIVNALLFNGEQVINEDSLTDAQKFSQFKANGKIRSQERDVAKYWLNDTIRLSFIGFENQTFPEADMPLRIMSYDGAVYKSQILKKKNQKRKERFPAITLVLYFGTESRWNAPKSLLERLTVNEKLAPFVNDYKIHVFELTWLSEEQISYFKSDFRLVVEYLRAKRIGRIENWSRRKIKNVHEVLDLLKVISNDKIFEEIEDYIIQTQEEQGGIGMDAFMQKMRIEGRGEGIAIGKEEATNAIMSLFSKLYSLGKGEDVQKATTDREYLKKLMEEYQK